MHEPVISPVSGTSNVKKIDDIFCADVIEAYHRTFDIDVSRFFKGIEKIAVYECGGSGYRFYHPFNIEGDGEFYAAFQKFPWYYPKWKWEHQTALDTMNAEQLILEVGTGDGVFFNKLRAKGYKITGLELNKSAIDKIFKETGETILNETIQEHAAGNSGIYDVVCSFQVMEHIADIGNVIEASVACLKPGGKLIISVPNNESEMYKYITHPLNKPPHHVGLWDSKSLKNLALFFKIDLVKLYYEPVTTWEHRKIYIRTHAKMMAEQFKVHPYLLLPLSVLKSFVINKNYRGLTIQAHYIKK